MALVLLIAALVCFVFGAVVLVLSGLSAFVIYVPLFAVCAILLLVRRKLI